MEPPAGWYTLRLKRDQSTGLTLWTFWEQICLISLKAPSIWPTPSKATNCNAAQYDGIQSNKRPARVEPCRRGKIKTGQQGMRPLYLMPVEHEFPLVGGGSI